MSVGPLDQRDRQAAPFLVGLGVEPHVGHLVARQVVTDVVAARRPPAGEQPQPLEGRSEVGDPVGEEVVEHRVELLFRRVPGLEDVLVEANGVDRLDRDIGVGVGGQENAFGVRLQLDGLGQELDPGHARHALVDHEQTDGATAHRQLANGLQRFGPGGGRHDAVVLAVARSQVALNCAQHRRVVVDGEDDGLVRCGRHGRSVGPASIGP